MRQTINGLDDEMTGFALGAIVLSVTTIDYSMKLKETEKRLQKHIETCWMWEEWGE